MLEIIEANTIFFGSGRFKSLYDLPPILCLKFEAEIFFLSQKVDGGVS